MFWRNFKKREPKKSGWYLCTIESKCDKDFYGRPIYSASVMRLWWDKDYNLWIDKSREEVFQEYRVFRDETLTEVMHTDDECNKTSDVVAWKKCPVPKKDPYKMYQENKAGD